MNYNAHLNIPLGRQWMISQYGGILFALGSGYTRSISHISTGLSRAAVNTVLPYFLNDLTSSTEHDIVVGISAS